jgi:acyl carrier protein
MTPDVPGEVALYLERRERALGEVRRLLASIIDFEGDPGDIDPDAGLFGTGLGLDSLDAVEILVGLDIDLGIKLEGDDPVRLGLRSVNAVVDAVMRARGELP